jgi:hypothetical protein
METDDIDVLIRRNHILLAVAREERRACQEAKSRVRDTWRCTLEIRQRASSIRLKLREVRASAGKTEGLQSYGRQN